MNDACRVQAALADRAEQDNPARENAQAKDWAGLIVANVLGLDLTKASDEARVKAMLKTWISADVLRVEKITYGEKRKEAGFIFPGPNNPAEVNE